VSNCSTKKEKVQVLFVKTKRNSKSDKYGLKGMFQDVIDNFTCPKCREKGDGNLGFLEWDNEKEKTVICSSCGFKTKLPLKKESE
jgi:transcription elongation factor Elf1